jgi:phosphinothricin acetyltransferase
MARAPPDVRIRNGCEDDLVQLNDVYNHYIRETHITFDIQPITMERRAEWFGHYNAVGPHRLLVAVAGDGLLGYASSSPYRFKARALGHKPRV